MIAIQWEMNVYPYDQLELANVKNALEPALCPGPNRYQERSHHPVNDGMQGFLCSLESSHSYVASAHKVLPNLTIEMP